MKPMTERIKSAIESLDKVHLIHEDDWDDTLVFKDIIAIMIPFVPIDIKDKIEGML